MAGQLQHVACRQCECLCQVSPLKMSYVFDLNVHVITLTRTHASYVLDPAVWCICVSLTTGLYFTSKGTCVECGDDACKGMPALQRP